MTCNALQSTVYKAKAQTIASQCFERESLRLHVRYAFRAFGGGQKLFFRRKALRRFANHQGVAKAQDSAGWDSTRVWAGLATRAIKQQQQQHGLRAEHGVDLHWLPIRRICPPRGT